MAITAFPINTVLPTASVITNTAYGFLTATNVQASLQQLVDNTIPAGRQVIAGSGLTGGGTLASDRTLNVGAGAGIGVAADAVSLDIAALTEDTSPDAVADFIATYDASVAGPKKVKLQNLPSAGAPTVHNVKTLGAVGNGSTDDTAVIQAAVNTALAASIYSGIQTIYFPPGRYKITSPITFNGNTGRLAFQGQDSVTLDANFLGYILDRNSGDPNMEVTIRDIFFQNSGGGGIRCLNTRFSHFTDLRFLIADLNGIQQDNSNFNPCIQNVTIRRTGGGVIPPATLIGLKVSSGGGGITQGVDIGGMAVGAYGCGVKGGRFEQNVIGVEAGGGYEGCSFEANNVAMKVSDCYIINCGILGDNFSAHELATTGDTIAGSPIVTNIPSTAQMYGGSNFLFGDHGTVIPANTEILTVDSSTQITMTANASETAINAPLFYHAPATHGIQFTGGHNIVMDCNMGGFFSVGTVAYDRKDPGFWTTQPGHSHTFIHCRFSNSLVGKPIFVMPAYTDGTPQPQGTLFIGCEPSPSSVCKFSQLPSGTNRTEGMERDIDNCNTDVWGATAAGGGSFHVKVRFNGTNWTVIGK